MLGLKLIHISKSSPPPPTLHSSITYSHRNDSHTPDVIPHYNDVIMDTIASQIISLTIVYSTVYSVQIKENTKAPRHWAFVRTIHRGPVNSPHKWLVTRKMFPFEDVIMSNLTWVVFVMACVEVSVLTHDVIVTPSVVYHDCILHRAGKRTDLV